jgi:hypothetical protein
MARPGWPERNRAVRSFRQLRRFHHVINSDKVFGTHRHCRFVAHALTLAPTVIMLLRLAFMESTRRTTILENSGLARVHVFRERLPMMHRDGWTGKRATSAIPFAWFVWDRDHIGPATLNRISWKTDGFFL